MVTVKKADLNHETGPFDQVFETINLGDYRIVFF